MTADLSHWTPAQRPDGRTLAGRHARLESWMWQRHGDDLWGAIENHDALWDYLGLWPMAADQAGLPGLA
jgi:hypothetical protein